ncbi:MAG: PASTA domain-containing protein [Thermoanaerobaculum sp.]|nr:PASTA domain-containing protein [Thermoanaerobaculum sp.]MDW7968136.1 PASTA domain-containing protein [Thermoanaerobaculum sp.]
MKGPNLLAVLGMALGVVVGGASAAWVVFWLSLKATAVRVPPVEGLPPEAAARALQGAGLVPRLQDPIPDSKYRAGTIARQRPGAGFQLKRGSAVFLYPSLGAAGVPVPELQGLPPAAAGAQLEQLGLAEGEHCEVVGEASGLVVVAQAPPAGALVAPGSKVVFLVNRQGAERRVVMPDVVGESAEQAQGWLTGLGFRVDGVLPVSYPGLPPGTVVKQTPNPGGPAAVGTGVLLWVSR